MKISICSTMFRFIKSTTLQDYSRHSTLIIIRYIDFFKSSMPAKYDGRLSSFMDVRFAKWQPRGASWLGTPRTHIRHFNISGPIGRKRPTFVGLRRSWFDVLSIPFVAIANSQNEDEKLRFNYYFMDFNARVQHRFSPKATALSAFISVTIN